MEGYFVINLVHGKGLAMGDSRSSDPFAEFIFPDKKAKKSKYKPKTLNPIWRELIVKPIKMNNSGEEREMIMKVKMWDFDSAINES